MGLGQYKLGMCYLNGEGVPQDSKKAIKLFLKAANKGYYDGQINAQIALGDCYKNGEGVRKNSKKAVEWYTKAVCVRDIQCNREVQYKLAKCYEDGFGVEKDIIKAKILYRKAGNYPEASKALNDLLSNPANAEILKKHKKELKEYKNKAGEFYRKYSMANKWFNELSVKDCKKFMSQIKGMIIDGEYIPFEDVLKKRIIDFAENKNKVDECFRKRYSISEKEIRKWIPQTSDAEWEEYMQKYAPVVAVEEILHHQDSSFWCIY